MLTDDLRQTILSGGLDEGEYLRQRSLARRYGVSEVVLLYPHHQGLTNVIGRWQRFTLMEEDKSMSKHQITVATLDLNDLKTVPVQLEKLFADLSSHSTHGSIN